MDQHDDPHWEEPQDVSRGAFTDMVEADVKQALEIRPAILALLERIRPLRWNVEITPLGSYTHGEVVETLESLLPPADKEELWRRIEHDLWEDHPEYHAAFAERLP